MVSLKQLRQSRDFYYSSPEQLRPSMRKNVFEKRSAHDEITPFEKGKEWTFEFVEQFQPRTAELLLDGSEFFFVATAMPVFPGDEGESFVSGLVLEVNGQVIRVGRTFWESNPDDPGYQDRIDCKNEKLKLRRGLNFSLSERHLSLPEPLRMAYFHRIDGLSIPESPAFSTDDGILPFPIGRPWQSIDNYLNELRLKKKLLPLVEEMIPNVKPAEKGLSYTNFMTFLSSWGSFTGEKRTDGDHLFVKNHIQDGVVYYIRDADVENMSIIADPAEAIDRYCEHVLLRREERFDFRPWAIPFESPHIPAS